MIISLVGNATPEKDNAETIDGSDLVIRFNDPAGIDHWTGRRFDIWVLANSFGGRKFAEDKLFADRAWRDRPREIWFPRCLDVHKDLRRKHPKGLLKETSEIDFGPDIVAANNLAQPVRYVEQSEYQRAFDRLGPPEPDEGPTVIPSSGFVGLSMALDLFPDASFNLFGFQFKGWKGHPWAREKAAILGYCAGEKLKLWHAL